MSAAFSRVYIDIVGFCNAKCYYCHSGSQAISQDRHFMLPADLSTILAKLSANGYLKTNQTISLYNWGDPILHPHINAIAEVIHDHRLRFDISTNCSFVPDLDRIFSSTVDTIMFSVSGFSNETYQKMHGFSFSKIKANIVRLIELVRSVNKHANFVLLFHVYRYNINELLEAQAFCDSYSILFNPYYAILNHWWKLDGFIKNTLSQIELAKIQADLFATERIHDILKQTPANFRCPQYSLLVVDEFGNVVTCCQVPKNHAYYSSGNILTAADIVPIIDSKNRHAGCKECIACGLAFYFNSSIFSPDYAHTTKQRWLKLAMKMSRIRNRLAICMHG